MPPKKGRLTLAKVKRKQPSPAPSSSTVPSVDESPSLVADIDRTTVAQAADYASTSSWLLTQPLDPIPRLRDMQSQPLVFDDTVEPSEDELWYDSQVIPSTQVDEASDIVSISSQASASDISEPERKPNVIDNTLIQTCVKSAAARRQAAAVISSDSTDDDASNAAMAARDFFGTVKRRVGATANVAFRQSSTSVGEALCTADGSANPSICWQRQGADDFPARENRSNFLQGHAPSDVSVRSPSRSVSVTGKELCLDVILTAGILSILFKSSTCQLIVRVFRHASISFA